MQDNKLINEYFGLIKEKISKKDYMSALTSCDKFIKSFSGCALAYYLKGICYFLLDEYGNSAKNYIEALKLDKYFPRAYYNLGITYYFQGRYDDALVNIGKALIIFEKQKDAEARKKCIESLEFIQSEKEGKR